MNRAHAVVVLVVASMMTIAAPALADHVELEAEAPTTVSAGDIVAIDVVLRDSETSERVPGATVVVSREATIVGVTGTVELASAVTDELGRATLRWQQRAGADHLVIVAYATAGDLQIESEPIPLVVVGSGRQIVRSTSGVSIPGFGAWVLIGVIVTVWAIIQFALAGPMLVASRFEDEEASG